MRRRVYGKTDGTVDGLHSLSGMNRLSKTKTFIFLKFLFDTTAEVC